MTDSAHKARPHLEGRQFSFAMVPGSLLIFCFALSCGAQAQTQDDAVARATLRVQCNVPQARIRLLNIKPKFRQGMDLEPGKYHVEVSAPGYETRTAWVELTAGQAARITIPLSPDPGVQRAGRLVNTVGMVFVPIPPSSLTRTSADRGPGDSPHPENPKPSHVGAFHLGMTEVTQEQWHKVMGRTPSSFKDCGGDCPVESVSWNDVQTFIQRLNEMEKTDKYRLPTEAEWEHACRATGQPPAYHGVTEIRGYNDAPQLDPIAWYGGNSCVDYEGGYACGGWVQRQYACNRCGTRPVAGKTPNGWGLYDMLGNVWEWCQDLYEGPRSRAPDSTGPCSGYERVVRGGGWTSHAWVCSPSFRDGHGPEYRNSDLGFRVAMTP